MVNKPYWKTKLNFLYRDIESVLEEFSCSIHGYDNSYFKMTNMSEFFI